MLRAAYGIRQEKTADQGKEKAVVPIIEKTTKGIIVKVGSVPHPMEEKHYIEWIEVRSGDNSYLKWLHPGEKAEAQFPVSDTNVKARSLCNVHGLWTNKA